MSLAVGATPPVAGGGPVGPCALGAACKAKTQELSEQYRCRHCGKQLHGFISGCSAAKNPKDFRDGVVCLEQPCFTDSKTDSSNKPDGVAIAAAAGLPEFLWETQVGKRKRDPNAPKLRRQRYSKQHKESVLAALHNTPGSKLPEIAKQFNIPEGTLRGWYDEDRKVKAAAMDELDDQILTAPIENNDPEVEGAPKKKRRQRYSNETKIQVILALETRPNVSLNEVAKEFNVAAGTVRGWREEADKIQKQAMENRRVGAKANPSRDPLRRIWDAILSLFERNSRLPVAQRLEVNVAVVRTIGKQARDILLEEHEKRPFLNPTELTNMEKFKASETWARKWARDHQVISSKAESASEVEAASSRLTELQKIVGEYPPERVYTMTSIGLFYRILPHRTYVSKLSNNSRVRACKGLKCKDRLSLYICTNETGTDKIPITCIGKYVNPACFRVAAQKTLPYLHQKQTLSDAGTFQMWWRTVFLPHVRSRLENGEKALLLVESLGPCKADLLKDPTNQVTVEALPPSTSSTLTYANSSDAPAASRQPALPQCQALEYGVLETIKRRYRYRLLQEVMEAFDERAQRRKVAREANFPLTSAGLREGSLANVCDAMRLLNTIWQEVATTSISKSWQRTKLRVRAAKEDTPPPPPGQRAKSEKRQTTREKKQLIKDLNHFLSKHEAKDFAKEEGSNQLEEMVEKLKNCFLYTDGEVIEAKEMMESLEEWVGLEDSQGMIALFMEEIKQEMNIEHLVGLKEPIEGVVPEADEPDEPELEQEVVARNEKTDEELQIGTAIELATKIKATACTLFDHGNILGELAVRLDEASDSIFRLLRKQHEAAQAKREADESKVLAKAKVAKAKAAVMKELESVEPTPVNDMQTEPVEGETEPVDGEPTDPVSVLDSEEPTKDLDQEPSSVDGATPENGVADDAVEDSKVTDVGDVAADVAGESVDIADLAEFGDAQMELTDV
mmetsp:Transcript_21061/g.32148  ORF Transcript_21061/g.32148 Transcript_21061/m.32148 type:complete len:964 (+) Transcript_21061:75-2966(+)|eukprot:CAMPEP_0117057150 /NCGR_PEP_ID=MMETSP0472-20121206/39661_1 /TAXON_ID=693140 ORGANISM="Tiarina fusus, Strain LIS" /NCGR_SAMPLE_ID=MMETSP0472 /ASSEMBLY_ACC=CAM_ASM_000603 /LENGTH=963 /DNA_ID=CAMNT_0004773893 /DNA_START=8 /DNA_END=2899 /DNA_ORIENTATION=+